MSNESQETKDILPPNVAETLQMWDQRISETERFLRQNPDVRLTEGARALLEEYKTKREKVLYDFRNPPPTPPPAPTPELIKRISDEVQSLLPEIVARVIVGLAPKK